MTGRKPQLEKLKERKLKLYYQKRERYALPGEGEDAPVPGRKKKTNELNISLKTTRKKSFHKNSILGERNSGQSLFLATKNCLCWYRLYLLAERGGLSG